MLLNSRQRLVILAAALTLLCAAAVLTFSEDARHSPTIPFIAGTLLLVWGLSTPEDGYPILPAVRLPWRRIRTGAALIVGLFFLTVLIVKVGMSKTTDTSADAYAAATDAAAIMAGNAAVTAEASAAADAASAAASEAMAEGTNSAQQVPRDNQTASTQQVFDTPAALEAPLRQRPDGLKGDLTESLAATKVRDGADVAKKSKTGTDPFLAPDPEATDGHD